MYTLCMLNKSEIIIEVKEVRLDELFITLYKISMGRLEMKNYNLRFVNTLKITVFVNTHRVQIFRNSLY